MDSILMRFSKITNGSKGESKVFCQVHIGKRMPHSSAYKTLISRHQILEPLFLVQHICTSPVTSVCLSSSFGTPRTWIPTGHPNDNNLAFFLVLSVVKWAGV